jgi:DNA repair protein RadC
MVHPREVFKAAILSNSASVILFHNHPSGNTSPSKTDVDITERLIEAGRIIGIEVIDHVIVSDVEYLSMKEKNLL